MGSSLKTTKVMKVLVKTVMVLAYSKGRLRCRLLFSTQAYYFWFHDTSQTHSWSVPQAASFLPSCKLSALAALSTTKGAGGFQALPRCR